MEEYVKIFSSSLGHEAKKKEKKFLLFLTWANNENKRKEKFFNFSFKLDFMLLLSLLLHAFSFLDFFFFFFVKFNLKTWNEIVEERKKDRKFIYAVLFSSSFYKMIYQCQLPSKLVKFFPSLLFAPLARLHHHENPIILKRNKQMVIISEMKMRRKLMGKEEKFSIF